MPKIFIGGDSWGRGEWGFGPYTVKHKGLEQYFIDINYSVINSSHGGSSNNASITRLENSLAEYVSQDIIIWIQTDPIRDLSSTGRHNICKMFNNSFIELENRLLTNSYCRLQNIGEKFNAVIFLIGGCRNINSTIASKFPNLNILTASWVALLINQYHNENFGFSTAGWHIDDFNLEVMSKKMRIQLVEDVTYYRPNILSNYSIFKPDGYHPNRNGHQILYNFITEKLKL